MAVRKSGPAGRRSETAKSQAGFAETCICLVTILLPLFFNPFSTQPVDMAKVWLFEGVTITLLAGLVYARLKPGGERRQAGATLSRKQHLLRFVNHRPWFLPAVLFLAVNTVAAVLSINPGLSFSQQAFPLLIFLVLFFLLTAEIVHSHTQPERLVTAIIVGGTAVAFYGFFQFLGLDPLSWKTGSLSAVHATVGYSLYLGTYLAMVIPFTLARLLNEVSRVEEKRPLPYLVLLVLQVACLLFTLSRGALLAFLVSNTVFLWMIARRWQRQVVVMVSVMVLLIGSVFFFSLNYGWSLTPLGHASNATQSQVGQIRTGSNNDRLNVWHMAASKVPGGLWIGYGQNTFELVLAQDASLIANLENGRFTTWDPHNLILSQLLSSGILGLLTFSFLVSIFFWRVVSRLQQKPGKQSDWLGAAILASAVAFLVQTQFNPSGIVATIFFWLVLGMGIGLEPDVE